MWIMKGGEKMWLYLFDIDGKHLGIVFNHSNMKEKKEKDIIQFVQSIYPQAKFLYHIYISQLLKLYAWKGEKENEQRKNQDEIRYID